MPRRKRPADDEMIIVDRRDPPFFTLDNRIIDDFFGPTCIAVYACIARLGNTTTTEIAGRLNITHAAVQLAIVQLEDAGLLTSKADEE